MTREKEILLKMAKKALSADTSCDLISRADAIEIVLTYFIPRSHTGERGEHEEDFVRTIFKALPSADAVDCTDFIEWLVDRVLDETIWEYNSVAYGEIICRKLEKLGVLEVTEEPSYYIRHIENNAKESDLVYRPSAEAVQGEWIDIDNYYRIATCSHCHKVTMFEKWGEDIKPYDFCPNCGARMKGGAE